jgi:hypothetical protein
LELKEGDLLHLWNWTNLATAHKMTLRSPSAHQVELVWSGGSGGIFFFFLVNVYFSMQLHLSHSPNSIKHREAWKSVFIIIVTKVSLWSRVLEKQILAQTVKNPLNIHSVFITVHPWTIWSIMDDYHSICTKKCIIITGSLEFQVRPIWHFFTC